MRWVRGSGVLGSSQPAGDAAESLDARLVLALGAVFTFAVGFATVAGPFDVDPSRDLLLGLAGVGATIYVSYTVGMATFFRETPGHGSASDFATGLVVGLGICGMVGIALCLALVDHSGRMSRLAAVGFWWAVVSLAFIGGLVGALPVYAHEARRARHLNPDE